jgi:hypothetical protein
MTFLLCYLLAGHMTLALLIASNWFQTMVDVWLLVRIALTVALWPVPLYMYAQEKWQKVRAR